MYLLWLHCLFIFSLKFNCLESVFLNEKIDDNCSSIDHVLQTSWKWSKSRLTPRELDGTNVSLISHIHVRFLSCVTRLALASILGPFWVYLLKFTCVTHHNTRVSLRSHHWISFCSRGGLHVRLRNTLLKITKYMSSTGIIRNSGRLRAILWNVFNWLSRLNFTRERGSSLVPIKWPYSHLQAEAVVPILQLMLSSQSSASGRQLSFLACNLLWLCSLIETSDRVKWDSLISEDFIFAVICCAVWRNWQVICWDENLLN